jgi:hypothetical protein
MIISVSTAQAAVDTAQANADAASAALAADTATNAGAADPTTLPVTQATLAGDASTSAQAQAKLAVAKRTPCITVGGTLNFYYRRAA